MDEKRDSENSEKPDGGKPRPGQPDQPAQPDQLVDLDAVRARLAAGGGQETWRSLDEVAGTAEFQDWLHREFPRQASEWVEAPDDGVSRRRFLQLASASLALAGMTACTKQPVERIVPYVRQPEEIIPGVPQFYATSAVHGGYGMGVLAESHTGRPTKIEGNPDHPASLGATDVFAQASVLTLYDPERSQSVVKLGRIRTWGSFVSEIAGPVRAQQSLSGAGLRFLTGTVTSPTLADQMADLLAKYPKARWHRWEPAAGHARAASQAAFGAPLDVVYDFTRARVVLALESDFLCEGPASVRYSRDFAAQRRVRADRPTMNRLYAVESGTTTTSTLADHRLPLSPDELAAFAIALAGALGAGPGPAGVAAGVAGTESTGSPGAAVGSSGTAGAAMRSTALPAGPVPLSQETRRWVDAVAADLRANAGACAVVAGPYAPAAVQVLAHAMNQALGNFGRTVRTLRPVEADPVDHLQSLSELVRDLNAGAVEMLVVLGANPVYSAPADLNFRAALLKAPLRVHHGLYADETAELCQWHVPATHELESWGDVRAFDGTASLIQPLIEPLYDGKSALELLAVFFDRIDATSYELVRERWSKHLAPGGGQTFDAAWRRALHDGVIPATAEAPSGLTFDAGAAGRAAAEIAAAGIQPAAEIARSATTAAAATGGADASNSLTLLFRPDPTLYDGSYAPNAWLQELPKHVTKLTWDNALLVSPRTASRLHLETEGMVELAWRGRKLKVAVWVQPGHGDGCATLYLGHGRSRAGAVGSGHGFNAYALRTADSLWQARGVAVRRVEGRFSFASTQNHHLLQSPEEGMEEVRIASEEATKRDIVHTGTLAEFIAEPTRFGRESAEHKHHGDGAVDPEALGSLSLIPERTYDGYKWGMVIDLNACTGCSACVIACQSENNIPVVGKEQVLKGREMHWLRIDRYFQGDLDHPVVNNQPVPCMQCEKAPCEVVCPVAATVHSAEGLNDMVYNRCVGTRYCSNNCPYKVRRFNFLRYSNHDVPVLKMLENPDVTVRMRGVMEKCTYCVQRINKARIDSEVENRKVRPAELQTACQQACPTEAIAFGNLNDPAWEVTRRRADPRNYALLDELNTQPRTTYLAKLRNVNPALEAAAEPAGRG